MKFNEAEVKYGGIEGPISSMYNPKHHEAEKSDLLAMINQVFGFEEKYKGLRLYTIALTCAQTRDFAERSMIPKGYFHGIANKILKHYIMGLYATHKQVK